ncbi:MAG: ornithine cyclodeaminase [Chloroflexi bacterium]|nr:ornithine cyclodeaminase [Chloroflexota bacterium]
MRILSREDVRQALPMPQAIKATKAAFAQLSTGQTDVPLRVALEAPLHNGVTLFMPAHLPAADRMAVKIVSVFNDNPDQGLPLIHALVVVVDATTGKPIAVMDGTYLTALRTGAASGAATDLLARPDAHTAAVFGAGVQGRTQLEAICAVRSIQKAQVYDVTRERATAFATEMSHHLSLQVQVADTPSEAVRQADVICTATTATSPVFDDADVQPGTHINAVGAYTPQMQEIPVKTVLRAKVVIDHYESSLAEAGDLLIPMRHGQMSQDHIYAEIGEIAAGIKPGRTSAEEITFFKSVGVAVQDVAAASAALEAAQRIGLGTEVAL